VVGEAPAFGVPPSARALLVDEPGGAVVQHLATETVVAIVDFASKAELAEKLQQFIGQWNEQAHPFNWTGKSVAKVMAKYQPVMVATTGTIPLAA
jgi:hypothetical protein